MDERNIAFPTTGTPEGDARKATRIRRTERFLELGECPNGCGQLTKTAELEYSCSACGYVNFGRELNVSQKSANAENLETQISLVAPYPLYGIKMQKEDGVWVKRSDGLPFSGRKCELLAMIEDGDFDGFAPFKLLPLPGQEEELSLQEKVLNYMTQDIVTKLKQPK